MVAKVIEVRSRRRLRTGRMRPAQYLVGFGYEGVLAGGKPSVSLVANPASAQVFEDDAVLGSSLRLLRALGYQPRQVEVAEVVS